MRASRGVAVGLFVAGIVAVLSAQPRQPGGGFFGGQGLNTQVLANEDLQKELKITDAQKEKFKPLVARQTELNKKQGEAFKGAGGDKDKLKDLFTEMQKDREKLADDTKKVVDETLTADQKKRLKQIERQVAGPRAFADEETATALKLTDTQKSKIKSIGDDYRKDLAELGGGFGGGKGGFGKGGFDKEKMAENQKKREKLTKAAMNDIEEVLNDDQKKLWKDLVGEPFDTSKLRFGFGGGAPVRPKD